MRYDEAPGCGHLVRIDPVTATPTVLFDSVTVSNGIGWSPDGRRAYHVDSPTRRVDVCDLAADLPGARRPFVEIERGAGFPDGLTVDADGCVWIALRHGGQPWHGGQVRRYIPDGHLNRTIPLPTARPTACAFGGADPRDLHITTARTGLHGPHPHPYAGSLLVLPNAGQGTADRAFGG